MELGWNDSIPPRVFATCKTAYTFRTPQLRLTAFGHSVRRGLKHDILVFRPPSFPFSDRPVPHVSPLPSKRHHNFSPLCSEHSKIRGSRSRTHLALLPTFPIQKNLYSRSRPFLFFDFFHSFPFLTLSSRGAKQQRKLQNCMRISPFLHVSSKSSDNCCESRLILGCFLSQRVTTAKRLALLFLLLNVQFEISYST